MSKAKKAFTPQKTNKAGYVEAFFENPANHPLIENTKVALKTLATEWASKRGIELPKKVEILKLGFWTTLAAEYSVLCAYEILCRQIEKKFSSADELTENQQNRYARLLAVHEKKQRQKLYSLLYNAIF